MNENSSKGEMPSKSQKDENPHKGHRKRVVKRYLEGGLDSFPDHNILEMLLFFGIPQKDTNEIAHDLIEKFGSFSGVFEADYADLKNVKGMTENAACLLTMFLPVIKRYQDDKLSEVKVLETTEDIVKYISPKFIDSVNERIFVICFDSKNELICTRQLCEGDLSEAQFELKKLASIVLETKASKVILVHNHPNLIALPSVEDVEATKTAFNFLSSLKVILADHIIVAKNGESCSMLNHPKYAHIFYGLDKLFD